MFDFLSWGHLIVIALAALFILGPQRLPTLARDAARGLSRARSMIEAARGQLHESLGDDFGDLRELDLRRYRPATFLREQLFGEPESDDPVPGSRPSAPPSSPGTAAGRPPGVATTRLPPPVDWEAT